MRVSKFKKLLDELDGNSLQTLKEKNAKYAKNGDSLHNFRSGAEIMGCTTAQACWGYMTKHLADLRNKIDANDFSDREDFLEKCQDTINYIRFLWCIGNDEYEMTEDQKKETRPMCTYEDTNAGCWCTKTINVQCIGYDECGRYTPKEESSQNGKTTDSENPRNS